MKNTLLSLSVIQLLFILTLLFVDRMGGKVMDMVFASSEAVENYAYRKCEDDIIILGSSRAKHHYVPSIITDSLNKSCYNLGSDGKNIYFQYELLELVLKHHTPEMVICDLCSIDVQVCEYEYNFGVLSDSYPLYYVDVVKDIVDRQGKEHTSRIRLSHLYRYNSRFIDYFLPNDSKQKGFTPVFGEWTEPITFSEEGNVITDSVKLDYLKKMISLCKQNDIRFVAAVSPRYCLYANGGFITAKYEPVSIICEEENVPFLYYELDSSFLSRPELFKDPGHLNEKGAVVFSKRVVQDIKKSL